APADPARLGAGGADDPVGGRPQTRRSGRGDTDDRPVVALVRIHPGPSGARLGLPAATRRGLRSAADPPPRRAAAVAAGAARIPAVRPPHLHRARARAAGDPAAQRRAAGGPGPRILPPPRLPARAAAAHRGPGALGRGVPAPVITDSLSGHGFPASHPSAVPARARTTVRRCLRAAGGSPELASSLATATVAAERRGKSAVGAAHLVDYLDALRTTRLNGTARPRLTHRRAAALTVDADRGAAQLAFDHAADCLVEAARSCGVAVLSIHDSFPGGELGHFATRLAEQ